VIARLARAGALLAAMGVLVIGAEPAAAALSNSPDSTWMTNGPVRSVVRSGDVIYIGGDFTKVTACPTSGSCDSYAVSDVAAIDAVTGAGIPSFHPNVASADGSEIVYALAVFGGKVFMGGVFTSVDSAPRVNLAAVDATTGVLDPLRADVTGTGTVEVRTLLAGTDKVYVGGLFKTVSGKGRSKMAALHADGTVDNAWKPKAKGAVRSLKYDCTGGSVFAGGTFRSAASSGSTAFETRDTVARFDPTTGALLPWHVPAGVIPNGIHVTDLAATCEGLYAGYGGNNFLYKFDVSDDIADVVWTIRTSGNVQAVAVRGTQVLFGGHFSQIDATNASNVKRTRFAVVNLAGQVDPWAPSFAGTFWGPWDILSTDNQVYVVGDFTTVSGTPQQNFARFTDTP
jgi:hypothetical protein